MHELFTRLIGDASYKCFREEANELRKAGLIWHVHYNLPTYYTSQLVLTVPPILRKLPIVNCQICGKVEFIGMSSPNRIALFFQTVDRMASPSLCASFLDHTIYWGCTDVVSKEDMIVRLRELADALHSVPFSRLRNNSALIRAIPDDRLGGFVRVLARIPPEDNYRELFGSWLDALIEAGVLTKDSRKAPRGSHRLAKDGHRCLSIAEKIVDDWLYDHSVDHRKEPHYPREPALNPRGLMRADWEAKGCFIKYFGMSGTPEYDRRIRIKRKLCTKYKIKLIEIEEAQLWRLDTVLGRHLL